MIGFSIADILGGTPMNDEDAYEDVETSGPVFHVHMAGSPQKVLEKVIAADAEKALERAKFLLGDVTGLFVTGPHEYIAAPVEEAKVVEEKPAKYDYKKSDSSDK